MSADPVIAEYIEKYQREISTLQTVRSLKNKELTELQIIIRAIRADEQTSKPANFVRDELEVLCSQGESLDKTIVSLDSQIANKEYVVACLKAYKPKTKC